MTSVIRGSDEFNTDWSQRSRVKVRLANGYGSTNTAVRRWQILDYAVGSDITQADSSTLGSSFTINVNGIYAVTYSDQFNTANTAIITNTNTNLNTTPVGTDILAGCTSAQANYITNVSWTGYLPAGTVIRPRSFSPAVPSGTNTSLEGFTIVRIA